MPESSQAAERPVAYVYLSLPRCPTCNSSKLRTRHTRRRGTGDRKTRAGGNGAREGEGGGGGRGKPGRAGTGRWSRLNHYWV